MPEVITTQQLNAFLNQRRKQQPDDLTLKQLFYTCRGQWHWFVISVLVCVGAAYLHLLRTQPTYTRKASLLIKDSAPGNSSGDLTGLDGLGIFKTKSIVDNELIAVQSPALILDLVRQIHLDVSYNVPGFFRPRPLYGPSLPATVNFLELNDSDVASCSLALGDGNSYVLSDVMYNGETFSDIKGTLGDTIQTPYGRLVVAATPYRSTAQATSYTVSRTSIYAAAGSVSGRLSADFTSKVSTVIDITFTDTNIARAEEVLNTLITLYNQSWINDKNQVAISTSHFINERLAVIEQELGHVDSDISQYKSQNLIPDLRAATSMYMQQASSASSEIQQLNNELYMTRSLRSYVQNDANRYQLLPVNAGIDSRSVESLITSYNQKLLERNNLVANSSVNHPLVVDADKALSELRGNILHSIDNHIAGLNTQIQTQDRVARQSTAGIAQNPLQQRDLLSVERQQKVKESLYLFLLQKREENELSQAFTAYNTRLLTPPMGPMGPTAPQGQKILLMGLLIGLLIPLALIYLIEISYTKVRGRKDLEGLTAPFIGELPLATTKTGKRLSKRQQAEQRCVIQVRDRGADLINESFRIIRSNVEFMTIPGTTQHPHAIMVTSANPNSGKTFVSINLAASFSLQGKRVVCLDFDLRRRSLSRYVNKPKTGLVNYLLGESHDWRPYAYSVEGYPNLTVLPVGHRPPNPTELLYSPFLEQLIDELRQEFDYVIFDCPPFDVVADASIISKYAELSLFVIRTGIMEREHLKIVEDYYNQQKLPNLSILLNDTQHAYRYGYRRYGHNYGYASQYGNYNDVK